MAFPGVSEVDLILALQEAATSGGSWSAFLARVAGLTGARFAAMVSGVPGQIGTEDIAAAMPSGASVPIDATALAFVLTKRMRPERIYTASELSELIDTDEGLSLNAALARLGAVSVNAMRVVVPLATIELGIFGARAFDAAEGAVLRRLFPYLQAAARTTSRLAHERLRATITADLARRNSLGWFLLDRAGVVLDFWTALPDFPRGLRVLPGAHGDRLALADRAAETALTAILDRFGTGEAPRAQALWVSENPPMHLRIVPTPREWAIDSRQPAVLATLQGECRPGSETAALLTDLFGLLPSEARLAAALADGDRLSDAADRLCLTIETARNYSKKIFAKTGTQGQTDLVRLILSNGLAELDHAGRIA